MKNKIVTITLGVCLIVSLAGNVYFLNNITKNKDAVDAFSNQLVTAEGQINGLQEEVSNLQQQLAEREDTIASLEEEKENVGSNASSSDSVIETDEEYVSPDGDVDITPIDMPNLDSNADKYENASSTTKSTIDASTLGEAQPGSAAAEGRWAGYEAGGH